MRSFEVVLVRGIEHLQAKFLALVGHQHPADFVPARGVTVDDDTRWSAGVRGLQIDLHSAAHDSRVTEAGEGRRTIPGARRASLAA